jgi:hypothetical protein
MTQDLEVSMNRFVLSLVSAGALSVAASGAFAQPTKLDAADMDRVVAGKITPTKVNGGGNTPQGNANGVPTVNLNPSGKAPPGHN